MSRALQVLVPSEADEGSGQLVVSVELTPMCTKASRYRSRSSETAICCAEQVCQISTQYTLDLSRWSGPALLIPWHKWNVPL